MIETPTEIRYEDMRPVGDKLMVRPMKAEKKTKGGLWIPLTIKRPPMIGVVIAAGSGRADAPPMPEVGQTIIFHRFSGNEIEDQNEQTVILMSIDDVLAVMDPEQKGCICPEHK